MMGRLNHFLFESTQTNKFVTLFYGELETARSRVRYVNAGHVPPYVCRPGGETERLTAGGPALGLLDEAAYEEGEAILGPGDLLAMVTDGATEAASPEDVEFGDERLGATLRAGAGEPAAAVLRRIVGAAREWAGPKGCADDLTALVLRAL
jgi:sigma-B regulation protein RsbU (phosphoserine phosphatase)